MYHSFPTSRSTLKGTIRTFLCISFLVNFGVGLIGQDTLLYENFNSASGTTPPSGWTIQTEVGDAAVDVWHYDNPGRRVASSPIEEAFACFDSDRYSDNGLAEVVLITSPAFDASSGEIFILEFDQYFKSGYGAICFVEVYDGSSWNVVYQNSNSTNNPQHSSFDITDLVVGELNVMVRFRWTGNYSWFWIIDNILVHSDNNPETLFTELFFSDIGDNGKSTWGDYDFDGDLDLLFKECNTNSEKTTILYRNEGDNTFAEISLTGLPYNYNGNFSCDWGDYDGDSDLDLIMTGITDSAGNCYTRIYQNAGNSAFKELERFDYSFEFEYYSCEWGDCDNDGDLDAVISGRNYDDNILEVLLNNGSSGFSRKNISNSIDLPSGSLCLGDCDNDGDQDLLLIDRSGNEPLPSSILRNDGRGVFVKQTGITLPGLYEGTGIWGDYNSDGFLDLIFTGQDNADTPQTHIYQNMGNYTFIEQPQLSIKGLRSSSADIGDYDNDGDVDLILCGQNEQNINETTIYEYDADNFVERSDITLQGVINGSAVWGDYNNDRDLDILISGNDLGQGIVTVYRNNSSDKNTPPGKPVNLDASVSGQDVSFSWDMSLDAQTPQLGLSYNLYVRSDTGTRFQMPPMSDTVSGLRSIRGIGNAAYNTSYTLYSSLPAGNYYWGVQAIDNSYTGSEFESGSFTIVDAQASNITSQDVTTESMLITWERGNKEKCAVFILEGSDGLPTLQDQTTYYADTVFGKGSNAGVGWYCVYNGTGNAVHISGIGGSRVYNTFIAEYNGEAGQETYLEYTNSTNPLVLKSKEQFTPVEGSQFDGSLASFGDYDNDHDLDILVGGNSSIYRNEGNNNFSVQPGIELQNSGSYQSSDWGDYDNDGDLDIVMTGHDIEAFTKIYRNTGNNSFLEQSNSNIRGLFTGSSTWADYNNDGKLDLLITGTDGSGYHTIIYANNGDNTFSESDEISIEGVGHSSIDWCDYDNDGDQDFLLTGSTNSYGRTTILYQNTGNGNFTPLSNLGFTNVENGGADWGDYDNDGDMDLILFGHIGGDNYITKIYCNNGDNSFTEKPQIDIPGASYGNAEWGDYDNDGDLDVLLIGSTEYATNTRTTSVYRNDGNHSFELLTDFIPDGYYIPYACWGDSDSDRDLDLLFMGENWSEYSTLMENNQLTRNAAPNPPPGITAYITEGMLVMSWDRASDLETPQAGLSYNLRVGTTPGGGELLSPMSNANGSRTVQKPGNAGQNTSWTLDLRSYVPLPENIYFSVQTIDHSFVGSEWSEEGSEVSSFLADFSPVSACQNAEIQFVDESYSIDYQITDYLWYFIEGEDTITSSANDPVHTFHSSGDNYVELSVTNSIGQQKTRKKTINILPAPLVDFTVPTVCQGNPSVIENTSNLNGTIVEHWLWDFGDSTPNSIVAQPPSHGYINPGSYDITLSAQAFNGCSLSIIKPAIVVAIPPSSISANGPIDFCEGDSVILSAVGSQEYTYRWMIDGVNITGEDSSSLIVRGNGNYSVEIINSLANCSNISDPVSIKTQDAPEAPVIILEGPEAICRGDSAKLSVSYVDGMDYFWKMNGGAIESNANSHYAKYDGEYSILVSNSGGCRTPSVNSISFTIIEAPDAFSLSLNKSNELCEGDSLNLSVQQSEAYRYVWYNEFGPIQGEDQFQLTVHSEGEYSLEKINASNCSTVSSAVPVLIKGIPAKPGIDTEDYYPGECNSETPITIRVIDPIDFYEYQWYRNGIALQNSDSYFLTGYLAQGDYMVSAENNGCFNESLPQTIFYENAPPKPEIYAFGSNLWYLSCSNDSASYYNWYFNGQLISGANEYIYVADQNLGQYTVNIGNENGCFTASDPINIPENLTSIHESEIVANHKIYPNPTYGTLFFETSSPFIGDMKIEIISTSGTINKSFEFQKHSEQFSIELSLHDLQPTMYLLRVKTDKYESYLRFIVLN